VPEHWYQHDLNPIAFTVGDVSIPWYWLNYVIGWFWCDYVARKWISSLPTSNLKSQTENAMRSFMILGWLFMLLGARLGYIGFYNLNYYLQDPGQVIALWNGGMSFHGGLIGVMIAAYLTAKKYQVPIFSLTDPIALAAAPIIFFGRISNFMNGELPGRLTNVPWAVIFPPPFNDGPRHPSQIYEALGEGLLVGLVLYIFRNQLRKNNGLMSLAFISLYSFMRFLIEFFRQPDPQIGYIIGLSLGQWLSLIFVLLAGGILLNRQTRLP
jgi:phosphatidylglycerol---prolipoprotein diacylglyceryl transferase